MTEMFGIEKLGIINCKVHRNLPIPRLVEIALARGEGILTSTGALRVLTSPYDGRSPNDRFFVDTPGVHDQIAWGSNNLSFPAEKWEPLYNRVTASLQGKELFIFDGFVGADPEYRMPLRVITETAWQSIFAANQFIRPTAQELENFEPAFTVIAATGFKAIPQIDGTRTECFVVINFDERKIIIGTTCYGGEIKKSIFTVMNYLLPFKGVFPMHCSANIGAKGDTALFFGLSGTGKTTLSADPDRRLIGDDEHGWSERGIFNFEGGCYAKTIRLSPVTEPEIWNAIRFGAIVENVVVDPETRLVDFDSDAITENGRATYPLSYIPGAVSPSIGGHPTTIVFLTADAFGVMPPVAKLTKEQAMYHFMSGYTSKLAGTERGIIEPVDTFSACFGAPFMPLPVIKYAEMLAEKITKHKTRVILVNTGWTGGPYGLGKRMHLPYTRAMISAALDGTFDKLTFTLDPIFNVLVPDNVPGVPAEILKPRNTWADKEAYDRTARALAARFVKNFEKFSGVPEAVKAAAPRPS